MSQRFLIFMGCVTVMWIIFFGIFFIDKTSEPSPYEFPSGKIVAFEISKI